MSEQQIELGDRVEDRVTHFRGIVLCITHWLERCVRVGVQPEELKDGKPIEAQYFDVSSLEIIDKHVHQPRVVVDPPLAKVAVVEEERPTIRRTATGGPLREGSGFSR